MPQVPVSFPSQQNNNKNIAVSAPSDKKSVVASDGREELAKSVLQEISQKGSITTDFLDKFAFSHLKAQAADTSLASDYAALRYAAREEETQRLHQQQQQHLAREGEWTVRVGSILPDQVSLQAYLEAQLPAQQARLEQDGLSAQEAAEQIRQLRAQTVEKHILRSLTSDDWHTAQEVLQAQGEHLTPAVRSRCARQIRHSFATQQARELWQAALAQQAAHPQEAKALALEQIQEPDKNLREDIQREIVNLSGQMQQHQSLQRADVFEQLARAGSAQKNQLLATQTWVEGDLFEVACKAAQQSQQAATPAQQAWFIKNYFNPSADIEKAFSKGLCCGQDYFRLKAVSERRRGGQEPQTQRWLCRVLETWMHKQGFTSQDITQASYTVLSGSSEEEQLKNWKQLKTLLTY